MVRTVVAPKRGTRQRDVLMLCAVAALLLLPNLGGPRLWADEGDTAVFARTIVERGLPYAWDGRTFSESDRGRRLNADLLLVGTPWLPFYVTAGSFALLGESAFSARLPFALCGVASVALLYLLVLRLTADRRAALAAAALLLGSVQFLLYARQCRHYPMNAALTLVVLIGFLRLRERPRDPLFAIAAVLLYHTHPLPAAATLGAAGALAVLHPAFRPALKPYCGWLAVVVLLALPWLWVSFGGWQENSSFLASAGDLPLRLAQIGIEAAEFVPLLGWIALGIAIAAKRRLGAGDRAFLALAGAAIVTPLLLLALSLSAGELFALGLRYVTGILPLAAGITGVLAARASGSSNLGLAALLVLFTATHLPGASLLFAAFPNGLAHDRTGLGFHQPQRPLGPWLRLEVPAHLRELWETDHGSVARIAEQLATRADPEDILITNYEWEPLYFHTNLRQGLKIFPEHEIAAAARAQGLPSYVFEAKGARWVVWRDPWEGSHLGYRLERVRRELARSGARLQRVARVPETVWENRPELHFHRFPGRNHIYPLDITRFGYAHGRSATIFRVIEGDAPAEGPSGEQP
jgi:hypothetical protein